MSWKSKPTPIEACAHALYEALTKALTQNGRIHVEDLISAAAAIVGEASIEAAGDFNSAQPRVCARWTSVFHKGQ